MQVAFVEPPQSLRTPVFIRQCDGLLPIRLSYQTPSGSHHKIPVVHSRGIFEIRREGSGPNQINSVKYVLRDATDMRIRSARMKFHFLGGFL